jgi:hypothetical protein
MNFEDLNFVAEGSAEWDRMWSRLQTMVGDLESLNPEYNEAWQYMGTYRGVHEFRHRCHPRTNGRVMVRFNDKAQECVTVHGHTPLHCIFIPPVIDFQI